MTLLGCCTACRGTGTDAASPETNGLCWDCRATGHPHGRNEPHEYGQDCPDDNMLAAFIADQRKQARLDIASKAADVAMSYGWYFYQGWLRKREGDLYPGWRQRYLVGIANPYPLLVKEPNSFVAYHGTGV